MSWTTLIGKNLRELRFILCQTNERSSGMRNFISNNYLKLKDKNPEFPFIVRECEGADPYVIARYKFGVEKKAFTANLNEQEIEKVLQTFVEKSDSIDKQIQN